MATDYKDFIKTQRAHFASERRAVVIQQREIEKKLAEIDRELAALDAYETAKRPPKAVLAKPPKATRRARIKRAGNRGSKRVSRRDEILKVVADHPEGLTRGQLLEELGLKGIKAGESSVSNALTGLTKGQQVLRKDGKYFAPSA